MGKRGENMKRLRGQIGMVELIIFVIMLVMGFALVPTVGSAVDSAMGNKTLFPDSSPTAMMAGLVPFIFIAILIMSGILLMGRQTRQE